MAKSKITGKTFEEMLSESIELDLSAKFKDIIYEFISDVHAMGMVVYSYQEGNSKFLFKDSSFKKPVTDNELLAMYLDEVVATCLVDEDTALERCRDLENEKVQYYEYKDGSFIKRFYKIGEYYSGETYNDLNGFVPGNMPLVGTAVVGKDKIAGDPQQIVTLWEKTFTGERHYNVQGDDTVSYFYIIYSDDAQNLNSLIDATEVMLTFDGQSYTVPVTESFDADTSVTDYSFGYGDEAFKNCPVNFIMSFEDGAFSDGQLNYETEGEHTLKIERR